MPEDTKKQQKGKNDPKEQRKRRGRQHQPAPIEKKPEKEAEAPKNANSKAPEKPEKPTYEPPPPEFYKSLKRETDEILKITEEANSKYKKKEILSNWSKYEMPIESYEEIDEQENLGADYETLANTPLSLGGHFQFKHEKSWDTNTGPSVYDKYFDINMENLSVALSTIPFFERNAIDQSIFSEMDMQNMNHRATKFKQKYYKDKKYTTPELEAQERILNNLIKSESQEKESISDQKDIDFNTEQCSVNIEPEEPKVSIDELPAPEQNTIESKRKYDKNDATPQIPPKEHRNVDLNDSSNKTINEISCDNKVDVDHVKVSVNKEVKIEKKENKLEKVDDFLFDSNIKTDKEISKIQSNEKSKKVEETDLMPKAVDTKAPVEPVKNPVIESPEDLEKWLDDFLDG